MSDGRASESPAADAGAAVDQLQRLLLEQLDLVHQGHVAAAEALCRRTGALVQTIVATGVLTGPGGDAARQPLLGRYRELCLALTAQRDEAAASLGTLRRGRRLLKTYRRNMV